MRQICLFSLQNSRLSILQASQTEKNNNLYAQVNRGKSAYDRQIAYQILSDYPHLFFFINKHARFPMPNK